MAFDRWHHLERGQYGHWLAGFIDGEGSFNISRKGTNYFPEFGMMLRADDGDALVEAAYRTGLGRLSVKPARGNRAEAVAWRIGNKADVVLLVEILDRYPLRAKKAADFAIWREAVFVWTQGERGRWNKPDWNRLLELRGQLRDGRAYRFEKGFSS